MSNAKGLIQYCGWLTPAQAAEGILAAKRSAAALLADAGLLLEKQRWQRGTALAILAIEETGKIPILREVLLARNQKDLKIAWRSFRSHTKKNLLHMWPYLIAKGAKHLEDFREVYDDTSDHAQTLEAVKQLALYCDSCGLCHWSIPEDVISQDLAKCINTIAEIVVCRGSTAFESEAELELWVKHMKPVWKTDMGQMKRALLACYQEAHSKGILKGKKSPAEMMNFLYKDPAGGASIVP